MAQSIAAVVYKEQWACSLSKAGKVDGSTDKAKVQIKERINKVFIF